MPPASKKLTEGLKISCGEGARDALDRRYPRDARRGARGGRRAAWTRPGREIGGWIRPGAPRGPLLRPAVTASAPFTRRGTAREGPGRQSRLAIAPSRLASYESRQSPREGPAGAAETPRMAHLAQDARSAGHGPAAVLELGLLEPRQEGGVGTEAQGVEAVVTCAREARRARRCRTGGAARPGEPRRGVPPCCRHKSAGQLSARLPRRARGRRLRTPSQTTRRNAGGPTIEARGAESAEITASTRPLIRARGAPGRGHGGSRWRGHSPGSVPVRWAGAVEPGSHRGRLDMVALAPLALTAIRAPVEKAERDAIIFEAERSSGVAVSALPRRPARWMSAHWQIRS